MADRKTSGGELFIVDNSISGWTGLRYLQDWTEIANSFDIATGYFEIGGLLELDGKWQKLDKIRILMGNETTERTRKALVEAIKSRAEQKLDSSIEETKEIDPFLTGVPAIVEALKSGQIEVKIYDKDKFHAKTYITHAKQEVVGARALVGSSNFTKPGLTQNVELNIQVQTGSEVAQLQDWFNKHWNEGREVTEDILKIITRHTDPYTPFDVYTKAIHEFFKGHEMTASEWEETKSEMFGCLDRYQKEAYWALMKIAKQHSGAFLCDGVGLGKTFVGLMLIERLILHEGKRVLLFAPKGAKEGVWEPHLREWLPHIGGIGGGADFSNLAVFSHTDLNRTGDFPDRFKRIAELADVVIIDEAHHFRNPGLRGDNLPWDEKSRYYRLYDILDMEKRPKTIFMLTATPINNRIVDFRHMVELFTRRDEQYFARNLGINNFRAHFNKLERALKKIVGENIHDVSEHISESVDILSHDNSFRALVVQRSRSYARESQIREGGSATVFPERKAPRVAEYSIRSTYGHLLDLIDKAFARKKPLFSLPMYYPLAYYKGDDKTIDALEEGRQQQVVALIRTQFLKRFESSVNAFEMSCDRLLKKLLAFVEVHSETKTEKARLQRWKDQNGDILGYSAQIALRFGDEEELEEDEDDIVSEELLNAAIEKKLDKREYEVSEIIAETFLDLDQIVSFLRETMKFETAHDDKLKKLIRLLRTKDLTGQKVIVFTEFADTARYLFDNLVTGGFKDVFQIDGGTKDRATVIKRFSPYYNGTSTSELKDKGLDEIRILISTDVLSEGLNLQDACRLINYDIHWNPVRLMQRIGRVDRRLNPKVEEHLIEDHPEVRESRGNILFWNFLPPDELNAILTLYKKVTHKTLMISKTLGIEGKKLLTPEDDFDALREFNMAYEGEKTAVENLHLEYQSLLKEDSELAKRLNNLPNGIFSGRKKLSKGCSGVFFCYTLPALDKEVDEFTEEAGTAQWYLYDIEKDTILEGMGAIIESIRSKPNTPRKCTTDQETLIGIRDKVLKHIKNTYLKRIDAPLGVKPTLKCWMELNEG